VAKRWASPRLKSISNRPNDWLIERWLCVRANQPRNSVVKGEWPCIG
jgi:hypothetical protein